MKRALSSLAVLIAVGLGLTLYFVKSIQRTPQGQAPLGILTSQNLPEFKAAFNSASDRLRALVLLSPT